MVKAPGVRPGVGGRGEEGAKGGWEEGAGEKGVGGVEGHSCDVCEVTTTAGSCKAGCI